MEGRRARGRGRRWQGEGVHGRADGACKGGCMGGGRVHNTAYTVEGGEVH
jgi:hypothetical protein